LTGKYNKGVPAGSRASLQGYEWIREYILTTQNLEKVKQLQPIATELECTMAQLALAWCLTNPNVSTVITGATRPEQVVENMKALDVAPKLSSDIMERIDKILGNKPTFDED
jgi:aryl-alcohol dehydrogenase-like predicted oxidoreductase